MFVPQLTIKKLECNVYLTFFCYSNILSFYILEFQLLFNFMEQHHIIFWLQTIGYLLLLMEYDSNSIYVYLILNFIDIIWCLHRLLSVFTFCCFESRWCFANVFTTLSLHCKHWTNKFAFYHIFQLNPCCAHNFLSFFANINSFF